ncbi:transmembrane protein 245-like isoform X3 [Lethenteron reissneri]|uniref:transmembrane protein 245-like isoform X3 n=1 Tax=Lethenteron reissneri TaxID=7753 RepID=UPI002AB64203|nr:transmembrane protein 245-like isoform X3 [Lethenteron reissneri]
MDGKHHQHHQQQQQQHDPRLGHPPPGDASTPSPQQQQQPQRLDRGVRQAFRNAGAFVFVGLAGAAAASVCLVLEAFLRPLLWAALCGAFLHPCKRALAGGVRCWLAGLREAPAAAAGGVDGGCCCYGPRRPLVLAALALPPALVARAAGHVAQRLRRVALTLMPESSSSSSSFSRAGRGTAALLVGVPVALLVGVAAGCGAAGPRAWLLGAVEAACGLGDAAVARFASPWVWTVVCGYVLVVLLWWSPQTQQALGTLSGLVWIVLLLHLVSLTGSWRSLVLLLLIGLVVAGWVQDVQKGHHDGTGVSLLDRVKRMATSAMALVGLGGHHKEPAATTEPTPQGNVSGTTDSVDGVHQPSTAADQPPASLSQTLPSAPQDPPPSTETSSVADQVPPIPTNEQPQSSNIPESSSQTPPTTNQASPPPDQVPLASGKKKYPMNWATKKKGGKSDVYFVALLWAIVGVQAWLNLWLLQLLPIPVLLWVLKKVVVSFGVWDFVVSHVSRWWQFLSCHLRERQDALLPRPVRALCRVILDIDRKLQEWLESSVDTLISVLIVLVLVLGALLLGVFLTVKVHQESVHVITVTHSFVNETLVSNPEWANWLPEAVGMQKAVDSAANNVYQYGREWITSKLQKMLGGKVSNTTHIENQVLELWDRLYHSWFVNNATLNAIQRGRAPKQVSVRSGWVIGDMQDWQVAASFVHENIETFLSILESLWVVMSHNVNLLVNSASTLLTLLFYGGTAILNFVLSLVIFLTTLFYLLSSSDQYYKPVKWILSLTPLSQSGSSSQFTGHIVEDAIGGVFGASVKMASFYGLYTWLTHTLFGINVVYIPAALAATLGAVPFLGTYWAALPAVLELWLVQGDRGLALLLFIIHLLPSSCVDTAIYSEMSGGGHPYLTGLAVAGGVYYGGLEGAIIGPILLCTLLVAFNIYSSMLSSPSTPTNPLATPFEHTADFLPKEVPNEGTQQQ